LLQPKQKTTLSSGISIPYNHVSEHN